MKILYLHQYFNCPEMNGSTRSYEMAKRIVKAGHEVHIITSVRESGHRLRGWRHEIIDGINVHWFLVPYSNKMGYSRRILAFLKFAFAAARKGIEIGGDIVFATSTPLTIGIPGMYLSRRLKAPMVFEVRDLWPELPIVMGALKNPLAVFAARKLERLIYRKSSHVVALSPGMADGVADAGFDRDKISIIPNSSDIELFCVPASRGAEFLKSRGFDENKRYVVYAGTFGAINGAGYMAGIAKEMLKLNPDICFIAAGEGLEKNLIEKKAAELGVAGRNFFILPPMPKKEIPGLLAAAEVACSFFIDLPQMWNNSANKFFDSLAAGKPLMINYSGWQADILRESGAGIVVPPGNAREAALLLDSFLRDREKLDKAGCAAAELARKFFSRDLLAARLISVLEKTYNDHADDSFCRHGGKE